MRLVVTLSALDRAVALVSAAQDAGKTVEKLMVTASEMEALLNCPLGPNRDDPAGQRSCIKDNEIFVMGVPVVLEPRPVAALERPATERSQT